MRLAETAVLIVGVIHLGIAASELFLWKKPGIALDLKEKLGFDQDVTDKVAPIVANAGLYNAFVGFGLIWSVVKGDDPFKLFFLACVAAAGIFGAITLKPVTLLLQTVPALIAAFLIWHR